MSTLVIEHLKASDSPSEWARHLQARPEQTVTVRIATEAPASAEEATSCQYLSHHPVRRRLGNPAQGLQQDSLSGPLHSVQHLIQTVRDEQPLGPFEQGLGIGLSDPGANRFARRTEFAFDQAQQHRRLAASLALS